MVRKQLLVNEVKYSKFFTEYTEKEEHTVLFLFSLFVYPIYAVASTSLPDPLIALTLALTANPPPFLPSIFSLSPSGTLEFKGSQSLFVSGQWLSETPSNG